MFKKTTLKNQRGAVAIEFALVFVLFFVVMYGIVAYGVVFALQHSLVQAANEGARAAVRDVGGVTARAGLAQTVASEALAWLGDRAPTPEVSAAPCATTPYVCLTVELVYDYAGSPLVPPLPILGVVLPERLAGRATVQLDAVY